MNINRDDSYIAKYAQAKNNAHVYFYQRNNNIS